MGFSHIWKSWCDNCRLGDLSALDKRWLKKELKRLGWRICKDRLTCPDCLKKEHAAMLHVVAEIKKMKAELHPQ
jgi:hypothetical protein